MRGWGEERLPEEVISGEDLKEVRGWAMWVFREGVPKRGNRKCKGSGTGASLEMGRNDKKMSVDGVGA